MLTVKLRASSVIYSYVPTSLRQMQLCKWVLFSIGCSFAAFHNGQHRLVQGMFSFAVLIQVANIFQFVHFMLCTRNWNSRYERALVMPDPAIRLVFLRASAKLEESVHEHLFIAIATLNPRCRESSGSCPFISRTRWTARHHLVTDRNDV